MTLARNVINYSGALAVSIDMCRSYQLFFSFLNLFVLKSVDKWYGVRAVSGVGSHGNSGSDDI